MNRRLAKAFPDISGVKWIYNREEILERLNMFFKIPICMRGVAPICCFRAGQWWEIKKFTVLDEKKILINDNDEWVISKICVCKGINYFRDFIYVELLPDEPTGLYPISSNSIVSHSLDYNFEPYGVYRDSLITYQEVENGARFLNGKLEELNYEEVQRRMRYTSRYNFVICAKFNPINSQAVDNIGREYFPNLFEDESLIHSFIKEIRFLPRHTEDK